MYSPTYEQNPNESSSYLETILKNSPLTEELFNSEKFTESLRKGAHLSKQRLTKKNIDAIYKGVELVNKGDANAMEVFNPSTEAIVRNALRPVFNIKDNTYSIDEANFWSHLDTNSTIRNNIETAIPSIGRIELPTDPRMLYVGTGFLVARDLIMTNRHVADIFCEGLGKDGLRFREGQQAGIDFKEEFNSAPDDQVFYDITDVVMIHPYWDMALLRVTVPEKELQPLTLSTNHFEDHFKKEIVVIGYPAFDQRNNRAEQDRIFKSTYDIKRLQPGMIVNKGKVRSFSYTVESLIHDASTLGGNSGSAVIDINTGHVIGLHFAGIYRRANFAISMYDLAKDDHLKIAGLNFEGQLPSENYNWKSVWSLVDKQSEISSSNLATGSSRLVKENNELVLRCPVEITDEGKLSITVPTEIKHQSNSDKEDIEANGFFEGLVGSYEERSGYDENFLGETVPIPWLSDEQFEKVARNKEALSQRHVLPYTHFSIVMNRERRLPFFTAVNIDGANKGKIPKKGGTSHTWYPDRRISREAQMENEYYKDANGKKNPLDRGHMVRRIEPTWSSDSDVNTIIKAHNDTFHWTNCSPQHSKFNRQSFLWATIENYLLDSAQDEKDKISVFSGAVFKDTDPLYMAPTGVQLHVPAEFWKIVCYINNSNLQVRGFLLSQQREIEDMIETLDYEKYDTYQLPLLELEAITGLSFHNLNSGIDLKDFDSNTHVEGLMDNNLYNPVIQADLANIFS